MNKEANVILTAPLPHEYLGIAPGMLPRIVTIRRKVYLVEYWEPAVVPTNQKEGTWKVALATYDEGEVSRYMLSAPKGGMRRLREAIQYQAVEVWVERDDG